LRSNWHKSNPTPRSESLSIRFLSAPGLSGSTSLRNTRGRATAAQSDHRPRPSATAQRGWAYWSCPRHRACIAESAARWTYPGMPPARATPSFRSSDRVINGHQCTIISRRVAPCKRAVLVLPFPDVTARRPSFSTHGIVTPLCVVRRRKTAGSRPPLARDLMPTWSREPWSARTRVFGRGMLAAPSDTPAAHKVINGPRPD
jgi:hypothetical protein